MSTETKAQSYLPLIMTFAVGAGIWFSPHPEGISSAGWHMLAIFIATILGIIIKAMPMGALSILAIGITAVTDTAPLSAALSGFGADPIWLAVAAFFIARGFIKTHLGTRIAYYFISLLGRHSLSLGYSFALTELFLAPAIPSTTARSGGIIFPIVNALSRAMGSFPNDSSSRKIGAFLTLVAFQANVITMTMFLTAMVGNPMIADLAAKAGYPLSWGLWAKAAIVPGLISLIIVPYVIYKIVKPTIKAVPDAYEFAQAKLKELGSVSKNEWIMFFIFITLVVLWIFGGQFKVGVTVVAILGLAALLITRVLTWEDVLHEKGAWDTLIWFGTLVALAGQLKTLGVIQFFSDSFSAQLIGLHWKWAFGILAIAYFYSHYFFASNTAHISAMYFPLLMVAISPEIGTPPMLAVLIMTFFSNLYGGLTHYGTAPASVLFGSGFVGVKEWWIVGLVSSFINIAIWAGIGILWWDFLGII